MNSLFSLKWMTLQVVLLVLGSVACGQSTGGAKGTGGHSGSGGVAQSAGGTPSGTGGVVGSGGASSTGGFAGLGGSQGSGGIPGTGGASGAATGGSNAGSGGATGTGGAMAGGATGTGGSSSLGGSVGTGGMGGAARDAGPMVGSDAAAGAGGVATGGTGGQGGSSGQIGSGGRDGSAGSSGSGGATSSGGASGMTCPSAILAPGNPTRTLQVGGTSRVYVLHVPSAYTGKKAVPLIVDFHPHGSSGPSWQTSSPYPPVVDGEGVIMAFPSAITDWNVGPCCSDGVDDVGFAKAIVNEVKGIACIDPQRVYAAGFSMGGGMTNYVACNAADVFAAFAPASFDLLQENVADCKPVRPITVVSFRGTADTMVPYAGGLSNLVRPITFLGAVNTMKKWAELSGCTGSAADLGNNCQGYAASQCKDGVEVILCTKQGGGHEAANAGLTWPVLKRHTLP